MSKYRFKTKEEFIRDGLWDEEDNCPDKWALDGEMNKYLGKDVPDEFNVQCDKNKSFEYDDWLFQNTDYVLKEQQEYFDDLSQHIGRYIRVLVDNPHSGSGIKEGDIGKIISDYRADFPNRKAYCCTLALSEKHLGIKYELLPEDYSPEQETTPEKKEPNVEFIPGKWYKWYQKNHGNYHYGKVKEINITTDNLVMSPWIMQCDNYNYSGTFDLSKAEQIQEISVEEVQEFLPKDHSDKISKSCINEVENLEFKKGEYIVITDYFDNFSKDFISNHIYKQRCDSNFLQSEHDSKNSKTNGWKRYTRNNTHNWRYATQEEIQEYERRGKPYDVTELQKKELSMKEIQEECKKRFPIGCTYLTPDESTYVLKDNSYTYHIIGQTICAHPGGGLLYADGKWATLVSLPEENITEIPEYIECTETRESYFIKGNIYKVIDSNNLSSAKLVSNIDFSDLKAGTPLLCSMELNGKKYWKPSTKEKYDQQKPLTYESVSGCFPADKTMLIHDEVGQYISTAFDYWKNIPTFVEKEFDIYGPTPDIE